MRERLSQDSKQWGRDSLGILSIEGEMDESPERKHWERRRA